VTGCYSEDLLEMNQCGGCRGWTGEWDRKSYCGGLGTISGVCAAVILIVMFCFVDVARETRILRTRRTK